jgi:kynurenine formamidase
MDENTPLYGGGKGVSVLEDRSISKGDTANTKQLSFHNHSGTHIDFPNHFFENGFTSEKYEAAQWIFRKPYLIIKQTSENEIIDLTEDELYNVPKEIDFLILKTGFGVYREEEKYSKYNPGISPDLANRLKRLFPNLRVLGMDLISITSFQNRELGRKAHKNFLGGDTPILLIEDMNLISLNSSPLEIYCLPLLIKKLDGSPVTIIARIV